MTLAALIARLIAGLKATVLPVAALARSVQNRRDVMMLLDAPPGVLNDLGVSAGDVRAALTEPLWRDPSVRLADWSAERRAATRAARRNEA